MYNLISKSLLWLSGLYTQEDYNQTLDKTFYENPDNQLLLELEICSSDCESTFHTLRRFQTYEYKDFSVDEFGKCLLENLKTVYQSNVFKTYDYAIKCHTLWIYLPEELKFVDPFYVLSYADDPLSWGDEAHTRRIFEDLFDFYKTLRLSHRVE